MSLGLFARSACPVPDGAQDRCLVAEVDVADETGVRTFARRVHHRFGRIDLWVNNAGVLEPIRPVRNLEGREVLRHLEINVVGVLHGTTAYVELLREHEQRGVLVNISSGAARKPYEGWGAYCAGKAAVDRLTEVVALEERGVLRAYSVAPGVVDTEMQELIRQAPESDFPAVERFRELQRQNAFATPHEVAEGLFRLAFGPSPPSDVLVDLREL